MKEGYDIIPLFQYRKRYEITCDVVELLGKVLNLRGFNTASGMRSHVTALDESAQNTVLRFNTASGMRSHVTE